MCIFCSRSTNIRINHLHERARRLIYDDYELNFEELFKKVDHSPYINAIFRRYVLNYIKHTTTYQIIFSNLFKQNINSDNLRLKPNFVIPQVEQC